MKILGVKVDNVRQKDAVDRIADFLRKDGSFFITTPNSEIILYARRHPAYAAVLNKADLALPDSAGVVLAMRFSGKAERISGSDIVPEICRLARERGMSVAILGGLDEEAAQQAAATLRGWGNEVAYASHGVPKKEWENAAAHDKMIEELRLAAPQVLLVGFGHPKQEEWIDAYRRALPSAKILIGCGGTIDFLAHRAKRAPRWMRTWFEWLWRLLVEPTRIRRIWNAVVVFPITFIYASFRKQ